MTPNLEVVQYLILSQLKFKIALQPYITQRDNLLKQDSLFSDEIKQQFKELASQIIVDDVTRNMAVSTEEVKQVLEDLNFDEYLQ